MKCISHLVIIISFYSTAFISNALIMFRQFDGVPPSNVLKDIHPYSTLEHQILDIILPFSIALVVVSSLKGKYNVGW